MSFAPLVPINCACTNPAYRIRYSMYEIPPTEKITLEEFERFAIDRLKTLKALDNFRITGIRGAQLVEKMRPVLNKYLHMPKWGVKPEEMEDAIRRDVVSHFALRLAYCKPTNNERNWFLTQERALLQVRLLSEPDALENFIDDNNLKFQKIDAATWNANEQLFKQVLESYGAYKEICSMDSFYVVPFEQATDLVAYRKVLLRGGKAYVHKNDIIAIVLAQFRMHVSEALLRAFRQMPVFKKDERIFPLLESFPKQYLGKDYAGVATNKKGRHIDINTLDSLADTAMPLCMKSCHKSLRANHHMKHMGRMQYGLFLKGIGVTLEDALEFWRNEFAQKFGNSVFEKKYAYNIRHNYGLEGKKEDYTPYACQKIIEMKAQPGDDHGCPFRHWDQGTLAQQMNTAGIAPNDQSSVFGYLRQGQYMEACKQYFYATHPGAPEYIQNHPNKYFDMSMKYGINGGDTNANQAQAATTDAQMTDV